MDVSIEEMKSCIQEWYAQAMSYENLFEIHYAVMSECNKQAVYMAHAISEEGNDNGKAD